MANDRVRKRHRVILERRRLYLEAQLATGSQSHDAANWVRAEVAAIGYVLAVLDDADAIGLRQLGHLSSAEREHLRGLVAGVAAAS